jgi:phosphoribosylanthranilate isomerase
MQATKIPRVKICCIQNKEEAFEAIKMGASAIGLVSEMPSGPGPISDEEIAEIAAVVPPPIATFLLTSRTHAQQIIRHQREVKTNTIQIVDRLQTGTCQDIRNALPGIRIVQVIHVMDESSVEEAIRIAEEVDAVLLDSGNPNLKIKELGGTGRIHNWKISRKIREAIDIPIFLAGGLTPDNVREAIETVEPFGIDVCSGVRIDGKLDLNKLRRFFGNISDQNI